MTLKKKSDGYNATIEAVALSDEHYGYTCWITLHHDSGSSHQGFGGLKLDGVRGTLTKDFIKSACAIFGTTDLESLKGRRCRALYNFPDYNEPIAGIETDEGRFTLRGWQRKHFPERYSKSPLEEKLESVEKDLARTVQRAAELREKLQTLGAEYIDLGD